MHDKQNLLLSIIHWLSAQIPAPTSIRLAPTLPGLGLRQFHSLLLSPHWKLLSSDNIQQAFSIIILFPFKNVILWDNGQCQTELNQLWSRLKEVNPQNVTKSFLMSGMLFVIYNCTYCNVYYSGKSEDNRVLLTHDDSYKYHKHNTNRSGDTQWYVCAEKRRKGCPARATVQCH